MNALGDYIFLRPTTLKEKSKSGISITGDSDEPVGEDEKGDIYCYDPGKTINVTLRGEQYKVTKKEYLLAKL